MDQSLRGSIATRIGHSVMLSFIKGLFDVFCTPNILITLALHTLWTAYTDWLGKYSSKQQDQSPSMVFVWIINIIFGYALTAQIAIEINSVVYSVLYSIILILGVVGAVVYFAPSPEEKVQLNVFRHRLRCVCAGVTIYAYVDVSNHDLRIGESLDTAKSIDFESLHNYGKYLNRHYEGQPDKGYNQTLQIYDLANGAAEWYQVYPQTDEELEDLAHHLALMYLHMETWGDDESESDTE